MSDELRMILLDGIDGIPILAMISASLLFAPTLPEQISMLDIKNSLL